jgi:hypothetical protein
MSVSETYRIAYTAHCKLQLAADRPDRDLRFLLGQAFTLDNIRIRIAQIEEPTDSNSESDENEADVTSDLSPGALSFPKSTNRQVYSSRRRRSPPPDVGGSDSASSLADGDGDYEDDLRLERFASATGLQPRIVPDNSSDDEDQLISATGSLSKDELREK